MSNHQMLGVVLWCDNADRKAVIWCEDHGNLAYYTAAGQGAPAGMTLDAGDLIRFDLAVRADMRLVRNPRLVARDQFPDLARRVEREPTAAAPRGEVPRRRVASRPDASGSNLVRLRTRTRGMRKARRSA